VDQHHGDAVPHRVPVPALADAHDHLLVLVVLHVAPAVRARQDVEQLLVHAHDSSPLITRRTSAVLSSSSSFVRASTFSRSSGSGCEGRTLNHQSWYSAVSPSRRSCLPSANRSASSWILPC